MFNNNSGSANHYELDLDGKQLVVEFGEIAKQANAAVLVRLGDTVVLVSATAGKAPRNGASFMPLTVDYRERTYAAGRIPGGFFKREGRPREKEILSSRLIDRTLRPLFPEDFHYDVQINALVLSSDQANDSDIPALIGASLAVSLSNIPWNGPIGALRVGRIGGKHVINPTFQELTESDLDLVVAGRKDSIVMAEGGGKEIPEEEMIEAFKFAQSCINKLCAFKNEIVAKHGAPKFSFEVPVIAEALKQEIESVASVRIKEALHIAEKSVRDDSLAKIRAEIMEHFAKLPEPPAVSLLNKELGNIEYREARNIVLNEGMRFDGRKPNEIRKITCQTGVLPRTHGSSLFTRGQTQALVTVTLGSPSDKQIMDDLEGEYKERFLFHYNFPGFSTGETKPERGPGRREIGHGALARRALYPLLPQEEQFPYTIRIVSDILESNGSSSMASVCGGSLAFFDAGVSIKDICAGIAMGLMKENDNVIVLTDILGLEDHIGDMDFKVAGTVSGITAIQMDIKISGIDIGILEKALQEARAGRLNIIDIMRQAMPAPRADLSAYAPRLEILFIPIDKIGSLIGPGGKNIRRIIEETGAQIDIEDDGKVYIASQDAKNIESAKSWVEFYTAEVEVGKVYKGKVTRVVGRLGAFVEILPGKEGLVHISQLDTRRVEKVEDVLKEGDEVEVKVVEIDSQGRINLSRKVLLPNFKPDEEGGSSQGAGRERFKFSNARR